MTTPSRDSGQHLPSGAEVSDIVTRAGFRTSYAHDTLVLGDRPIPGHPTDTRTILFYRNSPELPWHGSLSLRSLYDIVSAIDETVKVPVYNHRPLLASGWLCDADELENWLGGACSVPVSRAEVRSIETGAA